MTLQLAYNTTDSPLLVDDQGFVIGGRSWGVVDTSDPIGKAELAAGRVVLADEDSVGSSDRQDAKDAVAHLTQRREALSSAREMSKQELAEQLSDEQLASMPAGSDGLPSKDALVDAVAASPSEDDTTPKPRSGKK